MDFAVGVGVSGERKRIKKRRILLQREQYVAVDAQTKLWSCVNDM